MRQIKFRAIVSVNTDKPKEMRYYDLSRIDDLNRLAAEDWDINQLMQFTGLHDKNGKEIYESDILSKYETDYEHEDYQAFVDSGFDGIEPQKKVVDVCVLNFRYWLKNELFGYEGEDLQSPDDWEVIGNIYENPELLG